jgi:hypothetical protein
MGKQDNAGPTDYLRGCLRLHAVLAERLFGKPQDLGALEAAVRAAAPDGRLSYAHVAVVTDSASWSGRGFWPWLSEPEISEELQALNLAVAALRPKSERAFMPELIRIFRAIEPVSALLRFIAPLEYGIFSPPVVRLLATRQTEAPSLTYLNYLADLRYLRDCRGFATTAEVDMALWVLQVGVLDGLLGDSSHLVSQFWLDDDLQAIRGRNLSRDLLLVPRLTLARALADHDVDLAGQLASVEFERKLRIRLAASEHEELATAINRSEASAETKNKWHRLRRVRNRVIHGKVQVSAEEVRSLADETARLEREIS